MRDYFDINRGHMVAVDPHDCRFGKTWQPVCIEDDCGYVGPFVPRKRARAIADEHVLKVAEDLDAGPMSDYEPKTMAEKLDAAANGQQFARTLLDFMAAMDRQRWASEDDADE